MKKILVLATEFLIMTNNEYFLFNELWPAVEKFNFSDQFLEIIEQFITARKLQLVPDQALHQIIEYYVQRDRLDLI